MPLMQRTHSMTIKRLEATTNCALDKIKHVFFGGKNYEVVQLEAFCGLERLAFRRTKGCQLIGQ